MERETVIPLSIGVVVALAMHAVAVPLASHLLRVGEVSRPYSNAKALREPPDRRAEPKPSKPDPLVHLGHEHGIVQPTIAWISYEHFQSLLAPADRLTQPAVQEEMDPLAIAPMPPEPSLSLNRPVPSTADLPDPRPEVDERPAQEHRQEEPEALDSQVGPAEEAASSISATGTNDRQPEFIAADEPVEATAKPTAAAIGKASMGGGDSNPHQSDRVPESSPAPESTPTSAPRSDLEADPFTERESLTVKPGTVITVRGIRIKLKRPRFSAVAVTFAAPSNPVVRITFDQKSGLVTSAKLVRGSGYPNVDGPVLSSVYGWKAEGERLVKLKEPFEIQVTISLR